MPGLAPTTRIPRSVLPRTDSAGVVNGREYKHVAVGIPSPPARYHAAPPPRSPRGSFHAHEDVRRHATGPRAQLAARRRRDRGRPARQAQADVHAPHRRRRLRRRRQRREDLGHRREAAREDVLPPLGLSGRVEEADAQRHARAPAGGGHPPRGARHAPEEPPRPQAAHEAQGLRRPGAPARGPEAPEAGDHHPMTDENQGDVEEPREPQPGAADEPSAEAPAPEQPAAEAPPAATDVDADEPVIEGDVEYVKEAPRVKPEIPGMDLEVDIVREGEEGYREDDEDVYGETDGETAEEEFTQPIADAAIDLAAGARYTATGKRKTAVARVILKPGTGAYEINGRT